ncbi:coiled-coil domain-containing protein 136-like isoform X2 [Silurus meridionalis]|uniref:coiled-coil domain-containing protein 136-like isoform X2 n=2 Tax=Silurus meridionalis TaxID=175797 RepID=UPI001EE9B18C|nr:coiled-coil domain-containing protein 136-like isoform X2 [Silurus meridionalis]XP_046705701.1 coiled-coil domain-containing protein 136-like isoform X2 [Silurus meridionalis]XP_046705704.1 coiled-coil domain-containing protein 136-like isoform X2 [Silurus meridionalis]
MDGLRLPPLTEEVLDSTEESTDLKAGAKSMDEQMMEKECEKAKMEGEEKEKNEKQKKSEEEELEELRAQILHLLLELEETRDTSQKHEENSTELQNLLEEERLASAHQAEAFTRQIQCLQAQLFSVQQEMEGVEQQKVELQEEVLTLQQATEEYELETVTLRAEIAMKSQRREEERRREGDVEQLKEEFSHLKSECEMLKNTNRKLTEKLHMLQRTGSSGGVECGEKKTVIGGSSSPSGLVDACVQKNISFDGKPLTPTSLSSGFSETLSLRDQLKQAEERAEQLQRQCDGVRTELRDLQHLFETSQKERDELELELLHCREELQKLTEERQFCTESAVLSLPFLGMIVIMAILWCCWSELASKPITGR